MRAGSGALTHLRSLGLPAVQRPRATGSRGSAGVRETQLVRAVRTRVFVEGIPGVRDVHVANTARTARGPDRGAIHAHPLPMTQIAAARETAALLVVVRDRRAAVVETEPARAVAHHSAQTRGERIPSRGAGCEHGSFPGPAFAVGARGDAGRRQRASR